MSDTKNAGGPAFPTTERVEFHEDLGQGRPGHRQYPPTDGMTLRDYFAAKAMQGLVSTGAHDPHLYDQLAKKCYILADSMLKAREQ